jgi:hypothetical protein
MSKKKITKYNLKEDRTRNKTSGGSKWILSVTVISFVATGLLLYLFSIIINDINIILSVTFVLVIVFIGIFADAIGVSVTAADETQFHSMAAKRIRGSKISILLIRHAHRVSSLLNDVISDICGIISGSVTAMIVVYISVNMKGISTVLLSISFSGFIAALTIAGKATGKTIAMKSSNSIVYRTAYFITFFISERWGKKHAENDKKHTAKHHMSR